MLLGCIGDDFTGSSDLANTLAKAGMVTTQYCGLPTGPAASDVEAGIVALKTRSIAPAEAVAQSLAAYHWLKAQGCTQFLFKYCSTFDSTPEGNIGPVADALAAEIGADRVIVCPAFPATGRSIYQGHLFVGDRLLNESGLQDHPLNPMTDSDIRRWLTLQSRNQVGLVAMADVSKGRDGIATALTREQGAGNTLIVVDAINDDDLIEIGAAAADLKLLTGGSGIALGLPENFRAKGLLSGNAGTWAGADGPAVVLSGSCSRATREQVGIFASDHPHFEISADAAVAGDVFVSELVDWAWENRDAEPLISSSADPDVVRAAQEKYGREKSALAIEGLFEQLAAALAAKGFKRIVSAGGETSGAVVLGLGCSALDIGPEIAPGVPALKIAGGDLAVALKSGNFGGPTFFRQAIDILGGE